MPMDTTFTYILKTFIKMLWVLGQRANTCHRPTCCMPMDTTCTILKIFILKKKMLAADERLTVGHCTGAGWVTMVAFGAEQT
jgi:hypothetical protein